MAKRLSYKQPGSGGGYGKKGAAGGSTPTTFKDRNLMGVDPLKEQFEPTESSPVRQHYKMAGGE